MSDDLNQLTKLFRELGASEPEAWAKSQVEERIPQVHRFLFLRQAWRSVVAKGDVSWITEALNGPKEGPGSAVIPALERLLRQGASENDLSEVVRVKQWELLARICYLLDDPGDVEDSVADVSWGLFAVVDEVPTDRVNCLIESVLETDPTGLEMS